MSTVDVIVESDINLSVRARQVCGMFDCPPQKKQRIHWKAELPLEERDWNIGLIVGPSGCGKTTIARHVWPKQMDWSPSWGGDTLIDCFSGSVERVASALNAVGFSTIPAWLRPFQVLSNGERFRADVARRMLEQPDTIVIDEFTSVVDRQVAKIASYAVQKYVRKESRQLVAVSCHRDIIEWLQPDWTFDPSNREFNWRSLQRRPDLEIEVARLPYEAWQIFAPFHYMSASLNKAARCFGLWCDGTLAAFTSVLHKPHAKVRNLKALSRSVTLPDFQGIGLIFHLRETVASAYRAMGMRLRSYPAHPPFIRSYRCPPWKLVKRAGTFGPQVGRSSTIKKLSQQRPCAVFEYLGPAMNEQQARRLLDSDD